MSAPVRPDFPPELRSALARGEPAALARFFDVYYERVLAYVRRLSGAEGEAEDLTQEIFLHVVRALASYDPARDPRPWLFTLATNKLRDHWRARAAHGGARAPSLDAEEFAGSLASVAPGPEAGLGAAELAVRVRAAIDALPEGLRATLVLRVYEELSFEEIGRVLERNEVAVRKRYSRALAALREALGPLYDPAAELP
jgi:RNA polymerase sigma-70 factor (ECF subfamily)